MTPLLRDLLLILAHAGIAMACAMLLVGVVWRGASRGGLAPVFIHTLPIVAVAVGAYLAGGVSAAGVVLISCGLGALLFGNGAAFFVAPRTEDGELQVRSASAALIMPLGIILVLAGFTIYSTAANLAALLVLGIVALDLSRGELSAGADQKEGARVSPARMVLALVAVIPAAILAFNAFQIARVSDDINWLLQPEAYLVALVCPGVLVPLVRHATDTAAAGRVDDAVRINSSVAFLCAGLLLPLLLGIDYAIQWWSEDYARVANIPGLSWRLDTPLYIVAGFALLGLRFGVLRLDRWVAILFMLLYGAYIMASTGLRVG